VGEPGREARRPLAVARRLNDDLQQFGVSAKEWCVHRQLTHLDLFARRDELREMLCGSEVKRRRQDRVPLDAMFLDPVGRRSTQVDFKDGINARDLQTPAEQRVALARCGARGARGVDIDPEALALEGIGWQCHRRARPAVVDHLELHAMNEECREGFRELLCFERVAPRAREQRRTWARCSAPSSKRPAE